jgi:hypothetical protein
MNSFRKIVRHILSEQVVKKPEVDFSGGGDHLVLPFSAVVDPDKYPHFPYVLVGQPDLELKTTVFSRTHPDGWTISAKVTDWEDYFQGVENFVAMHPKFGSVSGNFDKEVVADSEEGYANFFSQHPPRRWDPGEI